ncbi:hypothetical protein ACE939_07370 [Aquimarina sp. W85]|uniref:hypothetical protein n=1 Tax=Aquimarina rhodophyticola TaxID=3342246 RepID=UPI003672425E
MKVNAVYLLLIVLCTQSSLYSQYRKRNNPWILGVGINLIDDSGTGLSGKFKISENYNYSAPISMSLEKRYHNDYGISVMLSHNRFLEGKRVNMQLLEDPISFYAIDTNFKYYITNNWLYTERAMYEGYLTTGAGVSIYNQERATLINAGLGVNIYLSERIRLNLQGLAKLYPGSKNRLASNYYQYNIGLIFRFTDGKICHC